MSSSFIVRADRTESRQAIAVHDNNAAQHPPVINSRLAVTLRDRRSFRPEPVALTPCRFAWRCAVYGRCSAGYVGTVVHDFGLCTVDRVGQTIYLSDDDYDVPGSFLGSASGVRVGRISPFVIVPNCWAFSSIVRCLSIASAAAKASPDNGSRIQPEEPFLVETAFFRSGAERVRDFASIVRRGVTVDPAVGGIMAAGGTNRFTDGTTAAT